MDTFWKIVTYPIGIILFFWIGYGDVIREKINQIKKKLIKSKIEK